MIYDATTYDAREYAREVAATLEESGWPSGALAIRGLLAREDALVARLVFPVEDEAGVASWGSRLALAGPFPDRASAEAAVRRAIEEITMERPR
jgi:hypothetical protein